MRDEYLNSASPQPAQLRSVSKYKAQKAKWQVVTMNTPLNPSGGNDREVPKSVELCRDSLMYKRQVLGSCFKPFNDRNSAIFELSSTPAQLGGRTLTNRPLSLISL